MKTLKLNTPVEFPEGRVKISCGDKIMILGSCFADNIGTKLKQRQFDVCLNPFGTLYNPASISDAVARLDSGEHFTADDCVQIGSGSTKWGSFHHHTLAAKETPEEFLHCANESLDRAARFWKECGKVIITLGTSWCFRHVGFVGGKNGNDNGFSLERGDGFIVANCLKRDAREFRREFIPAEKTAEILRGIIEKHPKKEFVFTVSPIRHFKDGAHGNQLSKASLLLGVDEAMGIVPSSSSSCTPGGNDSSVGQNPRCEYFPAYEIVLDELRDYRFYAEDMLHPSEQAADYIFYRFIEWALPADAKIEFEARDKSFRRQRHMERGV